MEIVSEICVNSNWIARFFAKEGQEHCECFGECKVRVKSESGYTYILTEKEIEELKISELRRFSDG